MELATSPNTDPYIEPFEWSPEFIPAGDWPEQGLIPCDFRCDYGGWVPLLTGDWIACPSCQPKEH